MPSGGSSGEGERDGVAPAEGEMVYGTRPGKHTKNYGKITMFNG